MKEYLHYLCTECWFTRWLVFPIASLYLLLLIIGVFFSDDIIFHPGHASYQDDKDIIKLTTADGMRISARYLPEPGAQYTILYSHGNAEDLGEEIETYARFADMGFAIFTYDYHGYGTSEGRASERNTYQDIDAAYNYLTGTLHIPPRQIIIYGRSLGGGPSVDLAARKPAAGLVLQSCFATAFRARTQISLLPFDKYRSIDKIGHVRCPVLVIHGRADFIIPFHHGEMLYNAVRTPKEHLWVDDAGHNDIITAAGDRYPEAMQNFVALLDTASRKEQRIISPG